MSFAIFLDIVIVALLLWRQLKIRRVWPHINLRLAAVLGVVGLIELVSYTGSHHLSGAVVGVLVLSFAVGAVVLGAVRALTVRVWRVDGAVFRQGTWVTVGLWIVSLALHYASAWWIGHLGGPRDLVSASLLLWLAITYGVQNALVHHRAERFLQAAGPIDAHSEVVGGRWWAGGWAAGAARQGGTDARPPHAGAIDATAEPLPPGRSNGDPPGPNRSH